MQKENNGIRQSLCNLKESMTLACIVQHREMQHRTILIPFYPQKEWLSKQPTNNKY